MEISEFCKIAQDALARISDSFKRVAEAITRVGTFINTNLEEYRQRVEAVEAVKANGEALLQGPKDGLGIKVHLDLALGSDFWAPINAKPKRINLCKYVIPPLPASASEVDKLRWCWAWGWAKKHRPKLVHRYLGARKWRTRNKYKNMILREYLQGGYKDGYAGKAGC